MKHPDSELKSVGELPAQLRAIYPADQPLWFRGQSDKDWKLVPSLARNVKTLEAELTLIKRFKQNALTFLQRRPETDWDWLFLMQHYGAQTPLLDWTESPLVGLYFAVNETAHYKKDGALWCLLPKELNAHAGYEPSHCMELPFVGVEDHLDNYLPETIPGETRSKLNPMAIAAVRESARMVAQLGVFIITHRAPTPIEEVADHSHVWRFIVPASAKEDILNELAVLSINQLSLFPELTSVANLAKGVIV